MEKILKKYTTIPAHLYVDRYADKQLKTIVEEMQRPGYVLVARQMGKTNLLFNAKRTLENENRLFVYVDMSNLYENERDCYRNIIDNIIEPNIILLSSLDASINNIRGELLPPHKEYSKSLRLVLDYFKGDLVIILDEIDALKSVAYSDNIFAQIRSNYFSRTNFPVFERLTYILSGVIEPTELIKDRNKSPFNIGDKIYLDDFTKDEHDVFIEKSKLNINQEISDEIYSWTNGNPRLTFDICAEVENLLLHGRTLSKDQVRILVKSNYLTSYDIAPIDHIRELAKSDKQVRSAISNIHKKEISKLDDEIKKKLYLYGIINSQFDEDTYIKNKIIELSLSEEWIKSIDKLSKNDYALGLEKMDSGEYTEAIKMLSEFLSNSEPTKLQIEVSNYNLGFAYYKLEEFENTILYFSKEYAIDLYVNNSKSMLGICYLHIGRVEEGVEILEEIVGNITDDFAYRNALLNLAPLQSVERALLLYDDLFASTNRSKDDITEEALNQIRTLSLYYQAELYDQNNQSEKALEKIVAATEYANPSDSLYLIYYQSNLEGNNNEDLNIRLVNILINNNILFDNNNSPLSFSEAHLIRYLDLVFNSSNFEIFENLLNYSIEKLYRNKISRFDLAYLSSMISGKNKIGILKYLLSFEDSIDDKTMIKIYSDLSLQHSRNNNKYFEYFNKYLKFFKASDKVVRDDIYLFSIGIKHYSDSIKIKEGLGLCEIIDDKISNLDDEELRFESVIIYYWTSNLHFSIKNREKAVFFADKTLQIIETSKAKNNSMIDETGLKMISEQMKQIKNSARTHTPLIVQKKYGRNDKVKVKYKDGRIVEEKYKKVEADILSERCEIM